MTTDDPIQPSLLPTLPEVPGDVAIIHADLEGLARAEAPPTLKELVDKLRPIALRIEADAQAFVITAATRQQAGERLATIRTAVKAAEEQLKAETAPLEQKLRDLRAGFGAIAGPLKSADLLYGRRLVDFQQAENRRVEEENRQRRIREQQEEVERKRAAAPPAVVTPISTIAIPDAESLERFFNDLDATQAKGPAVQVPSTGTPLEAADEVLLPAPPLPPPLPPLPVKPAPAKRMAVGGGAATMAVKENWTWEVVDLSRIPDKYLRPREVNVGLVTKLVKAGLRDEPEAPAIAGIRIWDAGSVAVEPTRAPGA